MRHGRALKCEPSGKSVARERLCTGKAELSGGREKICA
ncbi:hypothetical protein B224_1270 [Aeromonas media WS]|nr:hypothetical protein B224_1270 [Aeromonas media WS]